MNFLAAFLNTTVGKFILNSILKRIWSLLTTKLFRLYEDWQQDSKDKSIREDYIKVEQGVLTNEEEIEITEDLLNGRESKRLRKSTSEVSNSDGKTTPV